MSKWSKSVDEYAEALTQRFHENYPKGTKMTEEALLEGAKDWKEYSYGASGVSLAGSYNIAQNLATPSELKRVTRKDGSLRRPNSFEENWEDTQARALQQASRKALDKELGR